MDFVIPPFVYSIIALCCFLAACLLAKPIEFNIPLWFKKLHWIGQVAVLFLFFTAVLTLLAALLSFFGNTAIVALFAVVSVFASFVFFVRIFHVNIFIALPCALAVTAGWVFAPNWLTLNTAAIIFVVYILTTLKIQLRYLIVLLVALFVYDIFNVFVTETMVKVAHAAMEIKLPIAFIIPASFSFASAPASLLGIGDVVLPGLVVVHAYRTGGRIPFLFTTLGWVGGVFAAYAAVVFFQTPQPALLFLVPSVFAMYFLAQYCTTKNRTLTTKAS